MRRAASRVHHRNEWTGSARDSRGEGSQFLSLGKYNTDFGATNILLIVSSELDVNIAIILFGFAVQRCGGRVSRGAAEHRGERDHRTVQDGPVADAARCARPPRAAHSASVPRFRARTQRRHATGAGIAVG